MILFTKAKTLIVTSALLLAANTAAAQNFDKRQIDCLAQAAYHEAKGEGKQGMLAVIHTTLNRVKDHRFPKSACAVVYQKAQYSWTKYNPKVKDYDTYTKAELLAKEVLNGKHKDITHGSLFFHANSIKKPSWAKRMDCTARIGGHVFYKPSK